jgi:hypothetical protein
MTTFGQLAGLPSPNLRLLALPAAAALAACALLDPADNDITFANNNTFIPSVRVSASISPSRGSPSEPQSGHGVELDVAGGRSSDTQALSAGQAPVLFGGQTFTGPQQLHSDFDFRFVELAYRYRKFFGRSQAFGIEVLGGAGDADLSLAISGATQRASKTFSGIGAVGSFGALWRFRPTTSLQARYTEFASSAGDAHRFDLYVAQALGRNAALRAGFAQWNFDLEGDRNASARPSTIGVRFSGPALALDLMF